MKIEQRTIDKFPHVWVTSDFHFNHKSIIKFEHTRSRFESVEQMDDCLINLWNTVVGPSDLVLYLGDFALCLDDKVVDRYAHLHGVKYLCRGNHDDRSEDTFKKLGFVKVQSLFEYDQIVFTHVPVHPHEFDYRWRANVHGHLHSGKIDDKRYFNACVDAHPQFTLWSLDQVLSSLKDVPYVPKRRE